MCTTTIAAAFGMLALWMWGHFETFSFYIHQTGTQARLVGFERSGLIISGRMRKRQGKLSFYRHFPLQFGFSIFKDASRTQRRSIFLFTFLASSMYT
jgi:hypothetical protein